VLAQQPGAVARRPQVCTSTVATGASGRKGVERATPLHVGAGTFQPVRVDNIASTRCTASGTSCRRRWSTDRRDKRRRQSRDRGRHDNRCARSKPACARCPKRGPSAGSDRAETISSSRPLSIPGGRPARHELPLPKSTLLMRFRRSPRRHDSRRLRARIAERTLFSYGTDAAYPARRMTVHALSRFSRAAPSRDGVPICGGRFPVAQELSMTRSSSHCAGRKATTVRVRTAQHDGRRARPA